MKLSAVTRRTAVASALALAPLGLSVPAASAAEDEDIYAKGGFVEFEAHGETLTASDYRPDGFGVRAS